MTDFSELYEAHYRQIHTFVVSRLSNAEAEDATQEVFIEVLKSLDTYKGESELKAWIYGVARNVVNSRIRKRRKIDFELPDPVDPENRYAAREELRRVSKVVENLSHTQNRVFELKYIQNRSNKQIAVMLNISTDAVKCSLHRTRCKLKENHV